MIAASREMSDEPNMRQFFPTLKRWKEKDERTLTEKATGLLAQCKDITIASIDDEGFTRP